MPTPDLICLTGFLGAGKTTLLNKLLEHALTRFRVAVVENDFGDEGLDAALVGLSGAPVRELTAGCVCCTLKLELKAAVREMIETHKPALVLVEPSGISRTSDMLPSLAALEKEGLVRVGPAVALVDARNFSDYLESFGDFFTDQISAARVLLLSHLDGLDRESVAGLVSELRSLNPRASILADPWPPLDSGALYDFITAPAGRANSGDVGHDDAFSPFSSSFSEDDADGRHHSRHHDRGHDDDHDRGHDDDHERGHDDDHDRGHDDRHDGDHNDDHERGHHHHHHAPAGPDVFSSWSGIIRGSFNRRELTEALAVLGSGRAGRVLRAKGLAAMDDGGGFWRFDFLPGHSDVVPAPAAAGGRISAIGQNLDDGLLAGLFKADGGE
ncbi:MAG: GTP-binding protein [Deltaproteobacteria bacterium]|nr:GTP-binding protein [Deltaproteobacteria bacterium]